MRLKEKEKVRETFFFIKKSDWVATILPNQKNVNLGYLLWSDFCEIL
jgi:hypothetical protein